MLARNLFMLGLCAGCSATGGESLGSHETAGGAGGSAGSGAGGTAGIAADGSAPPFNVQITNRDAVVIELVTLSCAGDCALVRAVARGGSAPYTYRWDDASTEPERLLCPDQTTTFGVVATDSTRGTPEFPRDPLTARANVTAQVLDCPPDGGTSAERLCVANPSFEGTPAFNVVGNFDAAPWSVACGPFQGADVWNETQLAGTDPPLTASDGATYARLYATEPAARYEVVTQALCAPLVAGRRHEFLIDLATFRYTAADVPAGLEIWAGNGACAEAELLWASPVASGSWQTHCVAFTPTQSFTHVTLKPRASGAEGAVFVDHLQLSSGCR